MTLGQLAAHEEIRQALYRHFRAADRLNATLDRSAFWDDGQFEGGPFAGAVGENMPAMYASMAGFWTVTNHYLCNVLIDLQGDHAFVEAYAITYHVAPPESLEQVLGPVKAAEVDDSVPHEVVIGIRYSVRMEERHGIWKIAIMKLIVDWSRVTPYAGLGSGGVMEILRLRGGRGRGDPSYPWHP